MELTEKEKQARKMVCLPLDGLATLDKAEARVRELSSVVGLFKIGKESYTRFGPPVVEMVQKYGADIFLDLKYNDIPNTVLGAAKAASEKGVLMFNVHASGGMKMLEEAVNGTLIAGSNLDYKPKVIGVTILTSIGPADYLRINKPLIPNMTTKELEPYFGMKGDNIELQAEFAQILGMKGYENLLINDKKGLRCNVIEQQVLNLAEMSVEAGLDGIVCSAADLYAVRDSLPKDFIYVTPGIKGPNTPAGADQMRVFTPGNAVQDGSSYLVIGRAITGPKTAEERIQAGYEVLQDMANNL
ncbi:MAG: orotidine 5'-phosphate decarboxylase [Nanoarchaeota archaeon]|nr:orotidine 5'-phosphate decarboxylase [Nanoarchaeota archaeon]MBU1854899.1 orotidine 5'-phosphate decarboxylase [Nanoarchaeota archaeon]